MPDFTPVVDFFKRASEWTDTLVYVAIAIVTLTGVLKCLIPLWTTTHALRRATRRLEQDQRAKGERPIWQESKFMGRRLRGCWLRFLQNAEQLDHRGLPCNVEDYINDDTVTHGPGNAQLAELIPNLLTSLGILGTFMGMMQGLTGLDMSSSEVLMNSIPNLLEGMRFAFGTSVAGISCSLVFNMLNRISQGSSYRSIDRFVESFTQLAMQRPLDNDVQLICQNQDRNHMLFNATDGLASQMAGSIEQAVTRAMSPVSSSMDAFLVGATRAQVDGVGRIVRSFIDQMNESLNGQFLQLGQTLTALNQNQELTAASFNESMQAAEAIVQDVDRLHSISSDVIGRFEAYVQAMQEEQQRDAAFENAATDLLSRMNTAASQQTETLRSIQVYHENMNAALQRFSQESTATISRVRALTDESNQGLAGISEEMRTASEQLSDSYQTFVTDVVDGVSRAMGLFEQSMNGMITLLNEKVGASLKTADLSQMQRMLTDMNGTIQEASTALKALSADADRRKEA